jgi:hypothetical protein
MFFARSFSNPIKIESFTSSSAGSYGFKTSDNQVGNSNLREGQIHYINFESFGMAILGARV